MIYGARFHWKEYERAILTSNEGRYLSPFIDLLLIHKNWSTKIMADRDFFYSKFEFSGDQKAFWNWFIMAKTRGDLPVSVG